MNRPRHNAVPCNASTQAKAPGDYDLHRTRFLGYAQSFVPRDGNEAYLIELKVSHTMRVVEEIRSLAAETDWPASEERLLALTALYHDIGRFPQFHDHGAMVDRLSEDHGKLGCRVLAQGRFLNDLPGEWRRAILGAVFLHNKLSVPAGIPAQLDRLVRLLRDADKLDIVGVFLRELADSTPFKTFVAQNVDLESEACTPEVLQDLAAGRVCNFQHVVSLNDYKLGIVSWIYDLNSPQACRRFLERRHLARLLDSLPDAPEMEEVRRKATADLERLAAGFSL